MLMKRRSSFFRTVVAPIVAAIGVIPTLAVAVWETIHGHGAASYSNVYGLTIPYVSVLILVLLLAFVMSVAYIARIVYFWRNERDAAAKLRKIDSLASSADSKDS
jgi:hypothetical protein